MPTYEIYLLRFNSIRIIIYGFAELVSYLHIPAYKAMPYVNSGRSRGHAEVYNHVSWNWAAESGPVQLIINSCLRLYQHIETSFLLYKV